MFFVTLILLLVAAYFLYQAFRDRQSADEQASGSVSAHASGQTSGRPSSNMPGNSAGQDSGTNSGIVSGQGSNQASSPTTAGHANYRESGDSGSSINRDDESSTQNSSEHTGYVSTRDGSTQDSSTETHSIKPGGEASASREISGSIGAGQQSLGSSGASTSSNKSASDSQNTANQNTEDQRAKEKGHGHRDTGGQKSTARDANATKPVRDNVQTSASANSGAAATITSSASLENAGGSAETPKSASSGDWSSQAITSGSDAKEKQGNVPASGDGGREATQSVSSVGDAHSGSPENKLADPSTASASTASPSTTSPSTIDTHSVQRGGTSGVVSTVAAGAVGTAGVAAAASSETANASAAKTPATKDTLRFTNRESQPDDLQKINGIGPVIEKDLNEMGVYNYSQIANFGQQDIENVNTACDFPGRIERDEWIQQAKRLASEKTSTTSGDATPTASGAPGTAAISKQTLRFSDREEIADNLQDISGIGPVIEKDLNEMGVYNFSQIANFSQKDIDNVNTACDFPGRIERDDWIPQARRLSTERAAARAGDGIDSSSATSAGLASAIGGAAAIGAVASSSSKGNVSSVSERDSESEIAGEIEERIKILNMRRSDAPRLAVSADEFDSLAKGEHTNLGNQKLFEITRILRWLCD